MFIFIALIVVFILIINTHTFRNRNFDAEFNKEVISLVNRVADVKYRTHCEDELSKIFTDRLLQNYENYYPNFFRDVETYHINRGFMSSLYVSRDNRWVVRVSIREGGLFSGYRFNMEIVMVRDSDGILLIDVIGRAR